jgi:hypothetical protein
MGYYAGLDVSLKRTAICVLDEALPSCLIEAELPDASNPIAM